MNKFIPAEYIELFHLHFLEQLGLKTVEPLSPKDERFLLQRSLQRGQLHRLLWPTFRRPLERWHCCNHGRSSSRNFDNHTRVQIVASFVDSHSGRRFDYLQSIYLASMRCFPLSSALYFKQCRKDLQPTSAMALERLLGLFLSRLEISKLSIQKMSWVLIISVESCWTKSFLRFLIRAWSFDSLILAFSLFWLFLFFLESCLER